MIAIMILLSHQEEDKFCSVFKKPVKYIGILEIYYSKDFQREAPALKGLPPAIWKLCNFKKIHLSKPPQSGNVSIWLYSGSSLLGQVIWGTTRHNSKEWKLKTRLKTWYISLSLPELSSLCCSLWSLEHTCIWGMRSGGRGGVISL